MSQCLIQDILGAVRMQNNQVIIRKMNENFKSSKLTNILENENLTLLSQV